MFIKAGLHQYNLKYIIPKNYLEILLTESFLNCFHSFPTVQSSPGLRYGTCLVYRGLLVSKHRGILQCLPVSQHQGIPRFPWYIMIFYPGIRWYIFIRDHIIPADDAM